MNESLLSSSPMVWGQPMPLGECRAPPPPASLTVPEGKGSGHTDKSTYASSGTTHRLLAPPQSALGSPHWRRA